MPTRPITLGWGGRLDITRTSRSNCTPGQGIVACSSLMLGSKQQAEERGPACSPDRDAARSLHVVGR